MIKRYDPNWCQSFMEEDDRGNYVYADDYESLERDYNILLRDYQNMIGRLKDIWVEG